VKATEVTAGLAESNGSLLPGLWRNSLHVTCGLTACTPGSAPGPTLGNEYGKTLPFTFPYLTSDPRQLQHRFIVNLLVMPGDLCAHVGDLSVERAGDRSLSVERRGHLL